MPTAADDAVIATGVPMISTADAAVGSVAVSSGLNVNGRTLTVGATAPSTIAATVNLTSGNLGLNGTTTWSAGTVQITDAGIVENTGLLQVTGSVAVTGLRKRGAEDAADGGRGSDRGFGLGLGRRRRSRMTARCARWTAAR